MSDVTDLRAGFGPGRLLRTSLDFFVSLGAISLARGIYKAGAEGTAHGTSLLEGRHR
jgi:hypothetical protein